MSIHKTVSFVVVVFTLCVTSGWSLQCETRDFCSCVFDDGSGMMDLRSLGRTDGTPLFLDIPAALDSSVYSYNPCHPFDEGMCSTDISICRFDYLDYTYSDIGAIESAVFSFDGKSVMANYKSGDGKRSTSVSLICDPSYTTPYLEVMGEESPMHYTMTVTSARVCPVPVPRTGGGLSTGSVLLIILFVILILYLVAGVAYAKIRRSASGKELIPNLAFWAILPGLIKDGCTFTMKMTCCRGRQDYTPI